jgi:DNA-binding winged helix-turn-helix (wHTH) protein/tetratricopeptide (TPR) repeat protein
MPHNNTLYYEFGPYRLEVAQRVLTRTGETIALTPKATEILILLVTNAGQLVEKDELLKEVWPDSFVEDSNLTQNIFQLRRTLGDERAEPKYIETVARRGYRFIANVRTVHAGAGGSVADSENGLDGDGAVLPPRTVAVLPFVNATGDAGVEYLADGLTDNFVNNLARVSKLRVMSRSAVFRYKSRQLDPRVVGKELGVGVVLVGRIAAHPPGISIGVELVEVNSGWQIWGESFDCESKDILEVQDAITRHLLAALKLKLSGDEEKRVTTRYTESAEAYQAYLEGRYHWSKYTRSGIEKAIIHFRQAIELDPNYALAYAGIIDCYLRLATNYLPPEEEIIRLTAESSDEPDQHVKDSDEKLKLRFEWDWKGAERETQRAHELKLDFPKAHQWYAAYRRAKELFEQARALSNDGDLIKSSKFPAQILLGEPTPAEQLQVLCAVAREQAAVGNVNAAELVLKPWYRENGWPNLVTMSAPAAADLLFTLGLLIGRLAITKIAPYGHRRAEAFLTGSIALFENLGAKSQSVEAQIELARCFYRQGLFDLSRDTFSAALSELADDQMELKSRGLVFWAVLERDSGRLAESMTKLNEAAKLTLRGLLATGIYHSEAAGTLKDLAAYEGGESYIDRALLHYKAALYESEVVGNHRMTAIVENNLGLLLRNVGRMDESEKHLLRSLSYFEALADKVHPAYVKETLTRLYVATNKYVLAKQAIDDAIQIFEVTDGQAVLAEALTTSGIVLSRLANFNEAKKRFEAAYNVSERCGDREGARRALLSMFEEMRERLDHDELLQISDKLQRLQSFSEPSPLSARVEETLTQIASVLNPG